MKKLLENIINKLFDKTQKNLETVVIKHQEHQDAEIDRELERRADRLDIQELKSEQHRIIEKFNKAKKIGNQAGMNEARVEFRQSKINLKKKYTS